MIENRSGMPRAWFRKLGPGGAQFDVLAVRGTFRIDAARQRLTPVSEPGQTIAGDELDGPAETDPLGAVIRREGDTVLYKPATDIHVIGKAVPAQARPVARWYAGVAIANVQKVIQLCGPRRFKRGIWDWQLTEPEPVSAVSLDYRAAFGGRFHIPARGDDAPEWVSKPDNPAGCGWLPSRDRRGRMSKPARRHLEATVHALRQMPAPQLEDPRAPIQHPEQALPTQGFGPMARWCEPRASRQGTRDAAWREQHYPALPADFDPRFYQSAHPDLICAGYLRGDEVLTLAGLLPEGRVQLPLPAARPFVVAVRDDLRTELCLPVLDTVCVDLDRREVALTWRTSFTRTNPLRHAVLGLEAAP